MPRTAPTFGIACILSAVVFGDVHLLAAQTESAPELMRSTVQAIAGRAEALYSARISFSITSNIYEKTPKSLTLTVTGAEWALRYNHSNNIIMNREDALLRYLETSSEKGHRWYSLHLTAPQSQTNMLGSNYAFAASRLGTFWYHSQLEYIQKTKAEWLPAKQIHGHRTIALRWPVSAQEIGKAFVVVPGSIPKNFKGYLQVYAVPELGHALVRIDYVDQRGQLLRRYDSRDFEEIGADLFFPWVSRVTTFEGSQFQSFEFHIEDVELANQQIPASDFDVQVPPETRIRDSRPGFANAAFRLSDQASLKEIDRLLHDTDSSESLWSRRRTIFLALNGIFALYLSAIWMHRRWARHS